MAKKSAHTVEQITTFVQELEKQSDRGAALIAAAVLDELLEMLIAARLLDVGRNRRDALLGRGKPLDSFSAKIELGFQLGLYTNAARVQLEMIREVRNKFAHRIEPLTFSHPDVAKELTSRRLKKSPKGKATRQEFVGIFALLAMTFYGLMAADDIRIRPLQETHGEHLARMMQLVADHLRQTEAQKKAPGQPVREPAPDPSKPS